MTARAELPEKIEAALIAVGKDHRFCYLPPRDCYPCQALRAAILEALDEAEKREAAARLAGRLEQAEYAARESRNAMSLMGLQEFLDHLVDRLRAELAAAGREGE